MDGSWLFRFSCWNVWLLLSARLNQMNVIFFLKSAIKVPQCIISTYKIHAWTDGLLSSPQLRSLTGSPQIHSGTGTAPYHGMREYFSLLSSLLMVPNKLRTWYSISLCVCEFLLEHLCLALLLILTLSIFILPQPSWSQCCNTVGSEGDGGRKKERIRSRRRGAVRPALLFLTGKK